MSTLATQSDPKTQAMRQGGRELGRIRETLVEFAQIGVTFLEIEAEAQRLITQVGMKPSFSTVPGYHWATCLMKNDAMCHGIPNETVIEDGDVVTIDIGLINHGYHLDTTVTFGVGNVSPTSAQFIADGRAILTKAINQVKPGNSVYDISREIEKSLQRKGYGAVYQLTGHGIGRDLHMKPNIPCVSIKSDKRILLTEGQTIAVEVMYTAGKAELVVADDGWTFVTKDESLSGMFEETVLVTKDGFEVLTTNLA